MFRLKKIHKYAGITAGIVLILLSVSGFFLNHDNWKFLYNTTIPNTILPQATIEKDTRLYNTYYLDENDPTHALFCGFKGVEVRTSSENPYKITLDIPCYMMVPYEKNYFVATTEGIYISKNKGLTWKSFALKNEVVTSISVDNEKLLAAIDKKNLILLNIQGEILHRGEVVLTKEELQHDISLGRLVRDVHYGRGLFDDSISLFWNDFSTLWLILLAITGYILWYMIQKIRYNKRYKKPISFLLKIHTSSWVLVAVIPLILLVITGILLDHSKFFSPFLQKTKLSYKVLPPIYSTLKEDIWSIDIHEGIYRIGNRYGVYRSEDLDSWRLESKGFAYRMMHNDTALYVSGMGASNRVFRQNKWNLLEGSPHMFKSIYMKSEKQAFFSSSTVDMNMPKHTNTTLYSLLLSLHDGTFFASWWVFVNDMASLLLLVLLYTGLRLWYRRIRVKNNKSKF